MPTFTYEALDPQTGKTIRGQGEFQNVRELFRWLKGRGLLLIRYKTSHRHLWEKYLYRVSRRELAEFCRNLAFMIRAGVPLLQALSDLANATKNSRLARAILKLQRDIEEGIPFSEGLRSGERIFSPIVEALVQVGEESGRLDQTLEAAAEHLLKVDEIISNTKRALIYPCFLLVMLGFALGFWLFFVLPKILKLFQEMNISLPLATKILIKVVHGVRNYGIQVAVLFLGLPALFFFMVSRHKKGQLLREKFLLKLPFLGRIKRFSFLAFFFEYLALLLQAGIDLLKSLQIIERSLSNPLMRDLTHQLQERLQEGFSFAAACEKNPFFGHLELRIIKVGEETGRLVEQLSYLAEYYYKGLERLVQSMARVLEPALIVVAGLIFLIIVLALIGPIYDLISQIGRA